MLKMDNLLTWAIFEGEEGEGQLDHRFQVEGTSLPHNHCWVAENK